MKIRVLRRKGLGNTSTKAIKEYSKHDIEIVRSDAVIPTDTDLLIRWGTTTKFPAKKTLNFADAISSIANKHTSRKVLSEEGVSIPKLYTVNDNITFPVIVRPNYHSQGKKLWICHSQQELNKCLTKNFTNNSYYISEYIAKDREFGVFVFDGRVTSVIEKLPKTEKAKEAIAWNVSQGTHAFQNVKWSEWNMGVCKLALEADACFNSTFCRVDIIMKDNIPYVLELNSAHSLTSEYRQKAFTKCLDYYIDEGPTVNKLDLTKAFTYKTVIHPAIRMNAKGINK